MKPVIHVDGYDDDVLPEADKIRRAVAFLLSVPISNDDDVYDAGVIAFVLKKWRDDMGAA